MGKSQIEFIAWDSCSIFRHGILSYFKGGFLSASRFYNTSAGLRRIGQVKVSKAFFFLIYTISFPFQSCLLLCLGGSLHVNSIIMARSYLSLACLLPWSWNDIPKITVLDILN